MMEGERDYYQDRSLDDAGLKYRLESDDVLEGVRDALKGGGRVDHDTGKKSYIDSDRLMNDQGISRVLFFLRGVANKISHLTKYKNEERILVQVREMGRAFLTELTLNMKRWGPEIIIKYRTDEPENTHLQGDVLYIIQEESTGEYHYQTLRMKVRNKFLVMHVIENAILASLQRGDAGFEAQNLTKSWNVHEVIGQGDDEKKSGFMSMFKRRQEAQNERY